ncbi:MAG TPA: hypothetical protein PKO16_04640 [Bacteroidia bacterium]|jgi:hypothetical protein|nr:hypothetical protein [Bacteroidia bacterium]
MKKEFQRFSIISIEERIALVDYNGKEMVLSDIQELYDELEKMGNGKKMGIMNVFDRAMTPNEEIMAYINTNPRPGKVLYASAIVVESIAVRLVMMFYMKFYNRAAYRQVFSNRDKAMDWLREVRDKNT